MNKPFKTKTTSHPKVAYRAPIVVSMALMVLVFFFPVVCHGQDAGQNANPSSPPKTDFDVGKWIRQLESDEYSVRVAAAKQLKNAGLGAVPDLARQALAGKPESASRSADLLTAIALTSNEADMTRVGRVLNLLSESSCQYLESTTIDIQRMWKEQRVETNLKLLEEAGFKVDASSMTVFADPFAAELIIETGQPKRHSTKGKEQPSPLRPKPVRKPRDKNKINQLIQQYVDESDELSKTKFEQEILAKTKVQPSIDLSPRGATFSQHGDFAELTQARTFSIVVDGDTRIDESTLNMLQLLPSVHSLALSGQKLDARFLKAVSRMSNVSSISITDCEYDLKTIFEWAKRMPNTAIIATGNKAFLGVQTQVAAFDGEAYLCRVELVVEGSAAEEAGLKVGDVIETVDGVKIQGHSELVLAISTFKPGDRATLELRRGGELLKQEVRFKSRDEN